MQKRSRISKKILGKEFFERSTLVVARELLGKYLVRRWGGKTIALLINETEAYDGMKDKACHAHRGQTLRNSPMFGEAGYAYVYFTYGMHFMLNLVTGPVGYPAAVLIRGAGEVVGPARLTKYLDIDRKLNAKKLAPASGLWVEDRGVHVRKIDILRTPRIGINSAGPVWTAKPYRFVLKEKRTRPTSEKK